MIQYIVTADAHAEAKKLIPAKAHQIGKGEFANVYATKSGKRVFKAGKLERNHAYLKWASRVHEIKNVYFPKIFNISVFSESDDFETGYFVVEMERLTEANSVSIVEVYAHKVEVDQLAHTFRFCNTKPEHTREFMKRAYKTYSTKHRESLMSAIQHTLIAYQQSSEELNESHNVWLDLHPGNFLRRNNQIVITDPIAQRELSV